MIVPIGNGSPNIKRVLDSRTPPLLRRQGHKSLAHLCVVACVDTVEDPVRHKLLRMALQALSIKGPQLRLALIILTQVPLLQGYPGVDLIDGDGEFVLNMLNHQILTHRFELIANVVIIVIFFELLFQQLKSLFEHWLGPDDGRVGSRCETKIPLFERLTCANNGPLGNLGRK